MVVVPSRRWNCCSSSRALVRSFASRFESGSSRRNTAGSPTHARASAPRRRLPLAAGELAWLAVQQPLDPEHGGGLLHPSVDLIGGRSPGLEGKGDVLRD